MPKKLTLEHMQSLAKERGGKCLSKRYKNCNTKLRWECHLGHQWTALPGNIRHKRSWCPTCSVNSRKGKTKFTIKDMQELARERGGKCLSRDYVGEKSNLEWECKKGHRWTARPSNIKHLNRWCPKCAGNKRLTISDMQQLAKKRGGNCLSKRIVNSKKHLRWQCALGHRWHASPGSLTSGSWCPKCAKKQPLTLNEMHALAKKSGGKCLSKTYINVATKLEWQCAQGHRWLAPPSSIKSGHWCLKCSGSEKYTLQQIQSLAKERGGKCLSKQYVSARAKLEWQCEEGHRWHAQPTSLISQGTWCPECAGSKRLTIELMQSIAASRGGHCLSKRYRNAHIKLQWECAHGHRWRSVPDSIKNGTWCPECSSGISERICRSYFSQLFGKPFPKARPRWLISPRGGQMELDGYCKNLRVAFEHHGLQHYEHIDFFGSVETYQKQAEYDSHKEDLCKKHGVRLFVIPQLFEVTKLDDLQRFIHDECVRLRIRRPAGLLNKKIVLKRAWIGARTHAKLQEMRNIARKRGGKCLSKSYIHTNSYLQWECKAGHRWKAWPSSIQQGHWCPKCAGNLRLTIADMQRLAIDRGGLCLSKTYVNKSTKLIWQCEKGHEWKATPGSVRNQGTWCPKCRGK